MKVLVKVLVKCWLLLKQADVDFTNFIKRNLLFLNVYKIRLFLFLSF